MDIPDFQPTLTGKDIAEEDAQAESSGDDGDSSSEEEESESDEEAPKVRVPRHRSEEEEEDAGTESNALRAAMSGEAAPAPAARGGLGMRTMGGIGSKARSEALAANMNPPPIASTSTSPVPPSPGSVQAAPEAPKSGMGMAAAQQRRAFLGSSTPAGQAAPRKPAVLSKDEQKHFNKLAQQGGFGFELLKKMGWTAGAGLGQGGEGMVTPLESKLRPKAMGLAFEGFSERTKQAKQEEKRKKGLKGEVVSEDEEDEWGRPTKKGKEKQKAKQKGEAAEGPPAWMQKKPRKPKVQHMTYEEMVAGGEAASSGGVGAIYDLSGKELTSAALSHAASSHDVPTTDTRNLPELLHNLTMVSDFTKAEVDNLVREARISAERRKYLAKEAARIREAAKANVARKWPYNKSRLHVYIECPTDMFDPIGIARLQQLSKVATAIQQHSQSLAYDDRPLPEQMQTFTELFSNLLNIATEDEYRVHRLDEIIVAALAPLLKRAWMEWDVLAEPTLYLDDLKKWKRAFRCRQRRSDTSSAVGLFGTYSSAKPSSGLITPLDEPKMTAFETLMWTTWMPRVRSAVNNAWSPGDATPVLTLYSSWQSSGLLPDFISDNILDQLILPKIKRAVSEWTPPRKGKSKSSGPALHHVLFPWLEYAGSRMDDVMDDAKRKVRGWIKTLKVREGPPEGLEVWKEVIQPSEWDNLILQYIVPQLAVQLREEFFVNPRDQDLAPLSAVLAWSKLLRDSVLSQILETEFFPKYLETLHTWLSSSGVNFEQVAEWYTWWKNEVFGTLQNLSGVARGFESALDLMNQAMSLGEDAKYRLKKPTFTPGTSSSSNNTRQSSTASGNQPPSKARIPGIDQEEVTFRAVVEEYAAENNLVFMPTGRSHEVTGSPLFRVSPGVDGKGGVTIYLRGDVVYVLDKSGTSQPVGVAEMVELAKKKA